VVAAAPNRTTLVGRVEAIRPHPRVAKWDVLTLVIDSAAQVEGFNDMIRPEPGQRVDVACDRDWLPDRKLIGATVKLTASVAGPDVTTAVYGQPTVTVIGD
jgi:hypothetical protein